MRKTSFYISIFMVFILIAGSNFAQNQKLGQAGLKFLSVSTDARSAAMADAVTSIFSGSASMLYNPASMGFAASEVDISLGRTNWIADINYIYGTASYSPLEGKYGVFGVTYEAVDYGEFLATVIDRSDKGYTDMGTYSPTAIALGVGYSKALSDKFSVGGNVKYVRQSIGDVYVSTVSETAIDIQKENYSVDAFSFDFGILYLTGYKSLAFGMSIRNFSTEVRYLEEGFQLPLTFKIGISMNAFDILEIDPKVHSLLVSVDAVHPRDYYEQINVGFEYKFAEMVSLRAGYSTPNDEQTFSYGIGLQQGLSDMLFKLDYAYTPFGIFNDVHRFSFNFLF